MLDAKALGPGFPEWTELGQDSGLDPLGMQRPIEVIYQSLLPGISTITLRLRYYSFFPWVLEDYAHHSGNTDPEEFHRFQRKCETLYALTCARGATELGVAGIDWANRQLASLGPTPSEESIIDFSVGADPDAEVNQRYLRNKGGAFGGIYASQMSEMDLVKLDDPQIPIPYSLSRAIPLAEAFDAELGDLSKAFWQSVRDGWVSIGTLDRLEGIKPSRIRPGSQEQSHLAAVLFGRMGASRASDGMRRRTMRMLLRLAAREGRVPRAEEAKWHWFGAKMGEGVPDPDEDLRHIWALYQANDLFRLAYEVILSASLTILRNAPMGRLSLQGVVMELAEIGGIDDTASLEEFATKRLGAEVPAEAARKSTAAMLEAAALGETAAQVSAALDLIAALLQKETEFPRAARDWLNTGDHFQSLATEVTFMKNRLHQKAKSAIVEMVQDRIVKRHLQVASRKFRNQKAYTFLMEPDEGVLRYRGHFRISPSSPRIEQALQFLRDIHFLDASGITEFGKAELALT